MDNRPKLRYVLEALVNHAKNEPEYYAGVGTMTIEEAESEIKYILNNKLKKDVEYGIYEL